jgi:hypothetical protein
VQSFYHARQPNQETDSSPLSIVHLNVGVSTLFATKVDTFPKGQSINAYDYVQCPPLRLWIWKIKLSSWTKMAHTLDILNWLRDGVIPTLEIPACQELL